MTTVLDKNRVTSAPPSARILVVDDERSMRELLAIVLKREGHEVLLAENGRRAIELLEKESVELLISDVKMPDVSGVQVLEAAQRTNPEIIGIMITAYASTETAVEALRLGAYDYLSKPFNVDELKLKVHKALERKRLQQENVLLKRALQSSNQFSNIIGRSPVMLAVFQLVQTIAPTASTVLISGESGTGKELVARAIHFNSPRKDRPFVALNCGALPETLLESELFGHVRGAFTGADSNKKGLVEVAEKGTVFLDEIGEMSPIVQVKVLRVLQDRKFRRLGGTEETEADIRIIAATNRDLSKLVAEGKFREDLFYRINVIPVRLPPLRDRLEDIPLLAEHFLAKYASQIGRKLSGISPEAMRLLQAYPWPGNIRELENAIERAVTLEAGSFVQASSLPEHVQSGTSGDGKDAVVLDSGFDLERHVEDIEREYISEALRRAGGVKSRAAELLGMSFRSFRYYMKKYNLG
ncbi:MAG TPA: sigma-54 dependent transcriptional regulator [Vicinamibacterales bacterium]|nr:sigma-54 dependent transcriptional regulator [Vicinamibacterales bacterium]